MCIGDKLAEDVICSPTRPWIHCRMLVSHVSMLFRQCPFLEHEGGSMDSRFDQALHVLSLESLDRLE